ncbi:RNA-directed DNA polymerase, eukaryota [Tanacetum coccineum]
MTSNTIGSFAGAYHYNDNSLALLGVFSVASVRNLIDDHFLQEIASKTCWIKAVPKKVNILAWRVKLDNLPTRINLSHRGLELDSIFYPICNLAVETSCHLFFGCSLVKDIYAKISNWWDTNILMMSSYDDWCFWFSSLRLRLSLNLFWKASSTQFGGRFGNSAITSFLVLSLRRKIGFLMIL